MSSVEMNLGKVTLLLVAAAGVSGLVGCGEESTPEKPSVGELRVVPDSARAVSAKIGPNGGSLSADAASGAHLALQVPQQALREETTIVLTPIARIEHLPRATTLISAAQLEPEGLELWRPATLEISVPESVAAARLVAFGWQADGKNPYLAPFQRTKPTSVAIRMFHFSGAGAIDNSDASTLEAWTGTSAASFIGQVAALEREASAAGVLPWYDSVYQLRFSDIIVTWYHVVVEPLLLDAKYAAAGDAALSAARDAARAALEWREAITLWEEQYFESRASAPASWTGPMTRDDWDKDYRSLGLASMVPEHIDALVAALDQLFDNDELACRAAQICEKRKFVERLTEWIELATLVTGIGNRNGSDISVPDSESYCDDYAHAAIASIAIYDSTTGQTPDLVQLKVGQSHKLDAGAVNYFGVDVSGLVHWESSASGVASVEDGAISGISAGSAVITASDEGNCIADSVTVKVSQAIVLKGTVNLSGSWTNGGCVPCGPCMTGADFLTGYTGSYEIEIALDETGSGDGQAAAKGTGTISACCADEPVCAPESWSWTAHKSVYGFVDGHETTVNFDHSDYGAAIGLSLHGQVSMTPTSAVFTGDAKLKPFSCSCTMTSSFTLSG